MITNIWNNLSGIQRRYVIGGTIIVALMLSFLLVIVPFYDGRSRTSTAIKSNEKILKDISLLGVDYSKHKRRIEEVQSILAKRPADFTLFAYLDNKAGESGLKSYIKAMNPAKISTSGDYEEIGVEMKLERVTLRQVANYLYLVESPQDLIKIKRMSVTKMKEAPEYLNATLLVSTYQLIKTEKR
ncbi:MAG TPA: hypothetical protein DCG53_12535 [Syntrophus sp. (in: bacteria)]|jgi:hypothetical protein|nr:hypothetical protein [Syntrophus sp. (in: bacteria)]